MLHTRVTNLPSTGTITVRAAAIINSTDLRAYVLIATSTSWQAIDRAGSTTRAQILMNRFCGLVSDQDATSSGRSAACRNIPRLERKM